MVFTYDSIGINLVSPREKKIFSCKILRKKHAPTTAEPEEKNWQKEIHKYMILYFSYNKINGLLVRLVHLHSHKFIRKGSYLKNFGYSMCTHGISSVF